MSKRIDDGHQTLVSLASYASPLFWEISVTPPAIQGGGATDVTIMANETFRTMFPKSLKSLGAISMTVAYDPAVWADMGISSMKIVNLNNLITLTFPDESTLQFYGFINTFTPGELTEGERPTAEIEIIPTLIHDTTGAETAPVMTPSV